MYLMNMITADGEIFLWNLVNFSLGPFRPSIVGWIGMLALMVFFYSLFIAKVSDEISHFRRVESR